MQSSVFVFDLRIKPKARESFDRLEIIYLEKCLFKILKLFYSWTRESAGDGAEAVELLSQEFTTSEAAAGSAMLLGSLDRADYLPPPAATPAPTDVAHMSIGPSENAG